MKVPYRQITGSSNVAAVAFVPKRGKEGVLYVEFIGGRRYGHGGVKQDQFDDLLKAQSIGKFYAANIKGKHPVEFRSACCNASPCRNDATQQAVIAGTTVYVCDDCAKTQPQLRGIIFSPATFEQGARR